MTNDKGVMEIVLTRSCDRTAITVAGRRRGMPMIDSKVQAKVDEWVNVWTKKFGYSSSVVIDKR